MGDEGLLESSGTGPAGARGTAEAERARAAAAKARRDAERAAKRAARLARAAEPVRVANQHDGLVRASHWAHVPLLLGLMLSGLAIYWAAPVFRHAPTPGNPRGDYFVDLGRALGSWFGAPGEARYWFYERASVGPQQLANALRLHWLFAYLYMVCGAIYVAGLVRGGGWRALMPRASDPAEALAMMRYYVGVIPHALARKPWPHPKVAGKYNALQRGAYFTMPLVGALVVLSGWAMHHPATLGWLERLFGSFDGARIVHFTCMVILVGFMVPHVILAIADGWDTLRGMVTGWSTRVKGAPHA
jgi:thiosulfate reductase cytochrome b subunit